MTKRTAAHRSLMPMFENLDGLDLTPLEADLSPCRIAVSSRAGVMRLSPEIWNDASDIGAFFEVVRGCT
jgi:hypothetical protein